jgi:hypothetical protein
VGLDGHCWEAPYVPGLIGLGRPRRGMAQIRVRFEINKGGEGAPLDKLAAIASEAERFLRMLADDLQIEAQKGQWLAVKFEEGSVSFDAVLAAAPTEREASTYNAALDTVTAYDPDTDFRHPGVSDATLIQFSRLGQNILPHELIGIGLYNGLGEKPKQWRQVSYAQASRIRQRLEAPISSHGSVQGIIHALYKEADRPYFHLRELSTFDLIRCEYSQSLYERVIDALRHRRMTIHVVGPMKLDRASRSVVEVRAQRIEAIEPMSNDEFERFFGCAPEFTGDLSTEEYIEHARGHWD